MEKGQANTADSRYPGGSYADLIEYNNNNNLSYGKQACGDGLPRKPSMVANCARIKK